MPTFVKPPDGVRPYLFHGLGLDWEDGGGGAKEHAVADCPWCGREGKFTVTVEKGTCGCFVCGWKGNALEFMRKLWEESDKRTNGQSTVFAKERGLLDPVTLTHWGCAVSVLSGEWLIPGWSPERKLVQLYKRIRFAERWELRPTPTLPHALHGLNLWDPKKRTVYLHESWGNALQFWEIARQAKRSDDSDDAPLVFTGNQDASLLKAANVVAVANCGAAGDSLVKYLPLFAGKDVVLMFDADHSREHNGLEQDGAGFAATARVAKLLSSPQNSEARPASVSWLKWGERGFDPALPSGFDVRDAMTAAPDLNGRIAVLGDLLKKVEPALDEWTPGRRKRGEAQAGQANGQQGGDIECLPCRSWAQLQTSWVKAMKWTEGLDRVLANMLAAMLSTGSVGSQLWLKVISPPSGGKSTLCEALSVNPRHVKALSTLRGFHSGYKDGDGSDNKSLILKIKNKTLITKDGDTLLSAPNRDQILGEARDLFDKTARSDYRTGMGMDHTGVNMTWILCGTKALRALDQSELGARFLDTVIMEEIDDDLEDEINLRAAHRAVRNVKTRSNCSPDSGQSKELLLAMQLTGGYIDYLHDNAQQLLDAVEVDDDAIRLMTAMGKFVAFMRARPSIKQAESEDRELSPRLVEQFIRLSLCLAAVLSKKEVDAEVIRRVRRTALDTARGRTLEIARRLFETGDKGASVYRLAVLTGQTEGEERKMLRFLKHIGAVERFERAGDDVGVSTTSAVQAAGKSALDAALGDDLGCALVDAPAAQGSLAAKLSGSNKKSFWRLTQRMYDLYKEVVGV